MLYFFWKTSEIPVILRNWIKLILTGNTQTWAPAHSTVFFANVSVVTQPLVVPEPAIHADPLDIERDAVGVSPFEKQRLVQKRQRRKVQIGQKKRRKAQTTLRIAEVRKSELLHTPV